MTLLTTPIFDFHYGISSLMTATTTPTPTSENQPLRTDSDLFLKQTDNLEECEQQNKLISTKLKTQQV